MNGELEGLFRRKRAVLNLVDTMIGAWQSDNHEPRLLNGKIDEFSVRSRKMTSEEIARSYKIGLPKQ